MKRGLFVILIALCAALPAQAWDFATTGPVTAAPVTGLDHRIGETTLSNYYGMPRARPDADDDATRAHYALSQISSGERTERPCHLALSFATLDGGHVPVGEMDGNGEAFDRCGPDGMRPGSRETVETGLAPDTFATGLTVCAGHNDRIEGVRLRFTEFDFGPVLGNLITGRTFSDQFTRPACVGRWRANADCPAGQVIVGVRVYYSREGGPEPHSIIGLRPTCRALTVRP